MINIMAKRVSNSKRHILYLFYIVHRYLKLREGLTDGLSMVGKVIYLVSGRAPHSDLEGKKVIEAVYKLMKLLNNDPVT
jgi:glucan phosphorylase